MLDGMSASRFRLGTVLGINQLLTWGTTFYLPAVVGGPVAASLGQSSLVTLGAFSWSLLVTGACAPRAGRWIDEHGGRGALLTSIAVIAAGQLVLATSHTVLAWYLGWTIIGFGMSMGLYDAAFATAAGLLGKQASPCITGITLVAGLASTVFWTLGAAVLPTLGWPGLLSGCAGLMLLVNLPMVWLLVPPAEPRRQAPANASGPVTTPLPPRGPVLLLAGFFGLRWFITSTIAVHALSLLQGIGLTAAQAIGVAAVIGPGQVAGRILDYLIGPRAGLLAKARVGALLFPFGAVLLLLPGPAAATGFAVLYGISNGIMTINRGTLPLALFGPEGYARLLGWLSVPVLVAQAMAPTVTAPLVAMLPAVDVLLICGAAAAVAVLFLMPLRLPSD